MNNIHSQVSVNVPFTENTSAIHQVYNFTVSSMEQFHLRFFCFVSNQNLGKVNCGDSYYDLIIIFHNQKLHSEKSDHAPLKVCCTNCNRQIVGDFPHVIFWNHCINIHYLHLKIALLSNHQTFYDMFISFSDKIYSKANLQKTAKFYHTDDITIRI